MMPRFMSYRIVILNGEKRGERLDVGRSALIIGSNISCDIQLPDPDVEDIHAKISTDAHGLQINVLGETHLVVNKSDVKESSLKHGDVIEIGHTRLFVQSQNSPGTWESLTGLQKWRKWIAIGLPVLLITSIALVLHCCRNEDTEPLPPPPVSGSHFFTGNDTNNTDWMVTNVPKILIHSSIILTSTPPEIVEAKELFILSRSNNVQPEIDAARHELEFATSFLAEAHKHDSEAPAIPAGTLPNTILQQAEESLSNLTAAPLQSVSTNTTPDMILNEAATNQADSLKN